MPEHTSTSGGIFVVKPLRECPSSHRFDSPFLSWPMLKNTNTGAVTHDDIAVKGLCDLLHHIVTDSSLSPTDRGL